MNKKTARDVATNIHPHPRLLVSSDQLARLRKSPATPLLRQAAAVVAAEAKMFAANRALTYDPYLHNALLLRAREMQRRVITLLVYWKQTGDDRYRNAAVAYVRDMGKWKHWAWEMWKIGNTDPRADFDLSYGENSATLALAYDWLGESLSGEERSMFLEIAMRWSIRPFLVRTEKDVRRRKAWWFGKPTSNWNTVCAGGAGMLALAVMDEIYEAAEVVERVEESIVPYMESLREMRGGWVEGIGYWNYGHRYAFWYLLSHERSTGKQHPLLKQPGVAETLSFPLDFCPNGRPCSFGDVNDWVPLAFHWQAAARLGRSELIDELDKLSAGKMVGGKSWPNEAELLVFHPRKTARKRSASRNVQKIYPKLDWAVLADKMPGPGFYLSIRGGSTGWGVPHSQMDLLSFHCVVGSERLIDNLGINGGKEYLDTTFGPRRYELFEASPASKNTILINGVGIHHHAGSVDPKVRETGLCRVTTTQLKGRGWNGFRLDATQAMNVREGWRGSVRFCGRLFLMLDGQCAIILDKITTANHGRMETRLHTYSKVKFGGGCAEIRGKKERLSLAFAATEPSALYRAEDALTTPGPCSTMLRWCTKDRTHADVVFATLLAPGSAKVKIDLEQTSKNIVVRASRGGKHHALNISRDLRRVTIARK